jgi:hypothetical protein
MLEFDPLKRIHIKDLNIKIESSEHFVVDMDYNGSKVAYYFL